MTQAHGGSGVSSSGVWQCRSLQPALQRSHDERCPSGSGWGSGVSRPPARVEACRKLRVDGRERLLAVKHASSWPVKPRLEPSTWPDGTDSPRACQAGSSAPFVLQVVDPSSSEASAERGGGHTVSRQRGRRLRQGVLGVSPHRQPTQACFRRERRSGDAKGVLAGCLGCRSRRAAHGPAQKAMGLATCHRANPTCDGSRGENAPEAGSQWRQPRAREQRHRWRAPRDPTRAEAKARRATGGGSTRSMEGALARREPSSLTRRRGRPGLAVRRDGNSRPAATEGVRGIVAGSAHGRKHRAREAWRGGAVDRGPARTAPCRSRGRSGPAPERATLRGIT
jgi:hypothetical protein